MSPLFITNLGVPEIILILAVSLLIFGPKKLPEIGRSLGKSFREFKRGTSGLLESINEEASKPAPAPPVQVAPRPNPKVAEPVPDGDEDDQPTVIDLESEEKEA